MVRRGGAVLAILLVLGACTMPATYPAGPFPAGGAVVQVAAPMAPRAAAQNFLTVVARVEPVAEAVCRDRTRGVNCNFQIVIDDRPGQPPNAFQTLDGQGRPVLGFSLALIADARNADEIAFVVGHEAAHHIAGHLPQQAQSAMTGAILAGILASASGAGEAGIEAAQQMGATVAARRYSKTFELEADALGTEIAFYAGYDPVRGAAFFDRLPDPGDQFLGTHPANADRKAIVSRVAAGLQR